MLFVHKLRFLIHELSTLRGSSSTGCPQVMDRLLLITALDAFGSPGWRLTRSVLHGEIAAVPRLLEWE
jgi:hypothetical protein